MFQKLIISGYLGNEPVMRYLPNGTAVTNISVATSRRWTDNQTGTLQEETTWFRIAIWGRQAEAANQHLEKGRAVLVEGRLTPDSQTGGPRTFPRQDGTVGASYEVKADRVIFLGKGESGTAVAHPHAETDDIPF